MNNQDKKHVNTIYSIECIYLRCLLYIQSTVGFGFLGTGIRTSENLGPDIQADSPVSRTQESVVVCYKLKDKFYPSGCPKKHKIDYALSYFCIRNLQYRMNNEELYHRV